MPTYEYQCTKGHQFEVEQSMHDPALKRCRICRSKAQRLISASSFILKGGGWYSDGYGSAKSSSSSSSGESKGEAKSEPSPAAPAKPETKPSSGESGGTKTKTPGGSAASTGA